MRPSNELAIAACLLAAMACGGDKPPPATNPDAGSALDGGPGADASEMDGGPSPDAATEDAAAGEDGAVDAGRPCSGMPPLCYEPVPPYLCTSLSVEALCDDGTFRCPGDYVMEADCPVNDAMCPPADMVSYDMDGDACSLSVEIECFYQGDAGVPCPGNLYGCVCDTPMGSGRMRWSCVCLL